MSLAILAAIGLAVGLCVGLASAGGGMIAVPALIHGGELSPQEAISFSLLGCALSAAVGCATQHRRTRRLLHVALPFALGGALGATLGAHLGRTMSGGTLLTLFSLLVLWAGVYMIWRPTLPATGAAVGPLPRRTVVKLLLLGLGLGVLSGSFGIGGGFMATPGLVLLLGLDTAEAIAASLPLVLVNGLWGFGYRLCIIEHTTGWTQLLPYLACTIPGGWLGTTLRGRLSERGLRLGFGIFLLALGCWQLATALSY